MANAGIRRNRCDSLNHKSVDVPLTSAFVNGSLTRCPFALETASNRVLNNQTCP